MGLGGAWIDRHTGRLFVAAALLIGACGGGGGGGTTGVGGGAGTTGNAGTGGGGGASACTSNAACGTDEFCDFSSNRCSGSGTCRPRGLDCPPGGPQVCGCNGMVYASECNANLWGGVDISDLATCALPDGMFACGHVFCTKGTEFCIQMVGGAATNPGSYQCLALPPACGAIPTCACLGSGVSPCGNCTQSAAGDLTTACLFP